MSLLTKAKQVAIEHKLNNSNAPDEEIELAIAYFRHEVTAKQVAKVLGVVLGNAAGRMNSALATAARKGYIKLPNGK